jgi:AcrR family transcriptional regulator
VPRPGASPWLALNGPAVDSATPTRERLLDAAARLFAERGIDNVSLAEIVRAAGQRNTSAVHYHFGSRDEILQAVLARHVPVLAERRRRLLERARAADTDGPRPAAEAVVRPVTEFAQQGWRERAYLQIGSELTAALDRASPEIRSLMAETEGADAWRLLRERCPDVPRDLWRARRELGIVFVGRAAADRARRLDQGGAVTVLSDNRFVDNLIDMILGAMTAPSSGT